MTEERQPQQQKKSQQHEGRQEKLRAFGRWLREAREARGITLAAIVEETKIPLRHLENMEAGEFERLPGEVYTRGFLRSYARAVGLPPATVLSRYESLAPPAGEEEGEEHHAPPLPREPVWRLAGIGGWFGRLFLLLLLVLAGGALVFGWRLGQEGLLTGETRSAPGIAPAWERALPGPGGPLGPPDGAGLPGLGLEGPGNLEPPAPAPGAAGSPPAAPAEEAPGEGALPGESTQRPPPEVSGVRLVARALAPARVEVRGDGERLFRGVLEPGETAQWEAQEELAVRIVPGDAVQLELNGVALDVAGGAESLIRRFTRESVRRVQLGLPPEKDG